MPSESAAVKFHREQREDGTYLVPHGEWHFPSPDHMLCRYCITPAEASDGGERCWNDVTLGDGRRALLLPYSSVLRIREVDGHNSCFHVETVPCDRPGHETLSLYWVQPKDGTDE